MRAADGHAVHKAWGRCERLRSGATTTARRRTSPATCRGHECTRVVLARFLLQCRAERLFVKAARRVEKSGLVQEGGILGLFRYTFGQRARGGRGTDLDPRGSLGSHWNRREVTQHARGEEGTPQLRLVLGAVALEAVVVATSADHGFHGLNAAEARPAGVGRGRVRVRVGVGRRAETARGRRRRRLRAETKRFERFVVRSVPTTGSWARRRDFGDIRFGPDSGREAKSVFDDFCSVGMPAPVSRRP